MKKAYKKGDLSINIIIVAAIALLILVIISVLLFRSAGDTRDGTESCSAISGQCDSDSLCANLNDDIESGGRWIPNPTRTCSDETMYCCVRT